MEMSQRQLSTGKPPGKDNQKIRCYEFMGYQILVGMNALSNEKLVTEHEHKGCLWLHAVGASGAHVILCSGGARSDFDVPSRRYAASLALKFSDSSSRRVVSIAPLEDIYKPRNSRSGVFRTWRQETITIS